MKLQAISGIFASFSDVFRCITIIFAQTSDMLARITLECNRFCISFEIPSDHWAPPAPSKVFAFLAYPMSRFANQFLSSLLVLVIESFLLILHTGSKWHSELATNEKSSVLRQPGWGNHICRSLQPESLHKCAPWCPNIPRIIWKVSYSWRLIGQGMILHKWSLV